METTGPLGLYPRSLREVRAFLAEDRTIRSDMKLAAPGSLTVLTLAIVRLGQFCHRGRGMVPRMLRPLWALADLLVLQLCFETRIAPDVLCAPGLHTQHRLQRVTIDRGVVIGPDVTLLGGSKLIHTAQGSPILGAGSFIGTRSAIVGPVRVGERAKVSMGTVVLADVPEDGVVRGMPATLVEPAS